MKRLLDWLGLSSRTRTQRWLRRSVAVFLVLLIPNFIYAGLLHVSRPHEVVPATSIGVAERFLMQGDSEQLVRHIAENAYQEVMQYVNNRRNEGNIFHATTLGVFDRDADMAEYVAGHLLAMDHTLLPVFADDSVHVDIVAVVRSDVERAMELFVEALNSRNPFRYRKIIRAEQILKEINLILTAKVGERCHGVTTTWRVLTEN